MNPHSVKDTANLANFGPCEQLHLVWDLRNYTKIQLQSNLEMYSGMLIKRVQNYEIHEYRHTRTWKPDCNCMELVYWGFIQVCNVLFLRLFLWEWEFEINWNVFIIFILGSFGYFLSPLIFVHNKSAWDCIAHATHPVYA